MRIYLNKRSIINHLMNWLLLGIVIGFIFKLKRPFSEVLLVSVLRIATLMIAYYGMAIYLSPYFKARKWLLFFSLSTVLYILYLLCFFLVDYILTFYLFDMPLEFYPTYKWMWNSTVFYFMIVVLAHAFYENNLGIQTLELNQERLRETKNDKIIFMRNQFSPHVSFNFLSYCYNYAQDNPKTAQMIEIYSDMLRYTLDTKPAQPVPIEKEIQYLEQFIALQKELGKNIAVQFIVTGAKEKILILPCILITFIENAFKYGISNDEKRPIKIELNLNTNALNFLVENHIAPNSKQINSTGIGQINAKSHLDLYYKKNYHLAIHQTAAIYKVQLKINFKP